MGWFEDAKGKYGSGNYEYGWGGDGADTDKDGKGEFDCSHLLYQILEDAGYDVEYRNSTSMTNSGFYDAISDDIKPGDIIYFPPQGNRPGHAGIVETYRAVAQIINVIPECFYRESSSYKFNEL